MHLSAAELNQYIFDQILGFCSKTYLQSSTNKISIKEISINVVFKKSNFLIFRNVSLKSHSRDCHPDYSQKTVLSFDFLTHYLRNSLTKLMHLKSLCSLFTIDSGLLTLMALFSTDPFIFALLNKVQLTGAMYGMPESKVVLSGFSILLAKYKFCTKL